MSNHDPYSDAFRVLVSSALPSLLGLGEEPTFLSNQLHSSSERFQMRRIESSQNFECKRCSQRLLSTVAVFPLALRLICPCEKDASPHRCERVRKGAVQEGQNVGPRILLSFSVTPEIA